MHIVTAAQMQALDRRTITEARVPSLMLMERAGAGIVAQLAARYGILARRRVAVVCGKGNNGGDGFVVARLLRKAGARVQIFMLASASELSRDAKVMYRRYLRTAKASSVTRVTDAARLAGDLNSHDLVVDAILGTGLSSPASGLYQATIDAINSAGRPAIAVDLPSGLHADTGAVLGSAVKADLTVTLALPKLGLYIGAGIDCAGLIRVVDIGIPPSYIDALDSRLYLLTSGSVAATLPIRRPSAHKGTFGHAGIIAGSAGKTGAAAMAALAALRVGTGLVTVAVPSSVNDVLEAKLLEAMTTPMPETKARTFARSGLDRLQAFVNARTAAAIGPGLTTHPETVELVQELIKRIERPCVLDADALNALAGKPALLTECKIPPILTPHPGEMARLETEATAQSVNADRLGIATRFARERGVYVILKGARTVIARPDGTAAICPTGNSGMATGGTGDALTGIVVGLLAQGLSAWDAACSGVYLHGLAGDLAAHKQGQAGMVAGDLIAEIPHALASCASA
jgi:NAD(P)H-hydrate epimerase